MLTLLGSVLSTNDKRIPILPCLSGDTLTPKSPPSEVNWPPLLDPATLPPKPVFANEIKGVLIAVKQASDNAAILFILLLILNTIALSSYY